uniref:non-specific serine/threonine protein kinase n=1 Tax=Oryza nivara TaxID=4536 RepID=A0A0E0IZP1_ORYNI
MSEEDDEERSLWVVSGDPIAMMDQPFDFNYSEKHRQQVPDSTMDPTDITFRLLEEITDGFSEERKIGQGAYGTVYKGEFRNGKEIAVKMLHNDTLGFDDKQFENEFQNLMRLEHPNIVRLVAYCYETQHKYAEYKGRIVFAAIIHRALCFEYLTDEFHGLDWPTRFKIIKETCEGLKYLHEGLKPPIYHLDLKPGNILLDKNMVPKLADFGLSKLFTEEKIRITQTPIGTVEAE